MSILSFLLDKEKNNLATGKRDLETVKSIVYCIENTKNGMRYIGKTINTFNERYPGGKWWKYTQNKLLLKDYETYGLDAFRSFILERWDREEDLLCVEQDYIYHYNTFAPHGDNLSYDTDPLNLTGNGKLYIAKVSTGFVYVFQKDAKDNTIYFPISRDEIVKRKPLSEETKRKISIANKGSKRTSEQKERIRLGGLGHKPSPETIAKRSLALKGIHPKRVIQIDPITQNIITEHASIQDAAKSLSLKSSSNLSSVCKGRQKTAGGYIFRYQS